MKPVVSSHLFWKVLGAAGAVLGVLFMALMGSNSWWLQRELIKNSETRDLVIRLDTKTDAILTRLTAVENAVNRRQASVARPYARKIAHVQTEKEKVAEIRSGFQYAWSR